MNPFLFFFHKLLLYILIEVCFVQEHDMQCNYLRLSKYYRYILRCYLISLDKEVWQVDACWKSGFVCVKWVNEDRVLEQKKVFSSFSYRTSKREMHLKCISRQQRVDFGVKNLFRSKFFLFSKTLQIHNNIEDIFYFSLTKLVLAPALFPLNTT